MPRVPTTAEAMSKHCYFCGLPEEVLKTLFMKDDIGICDRCVECCNLIMAEPLISGAKEYDSWQLPQYDASLSTKEK